MNSIDYDKKEYQFIQTISHTDSRLLIFLNDKIKQNDNLDTLNQLDISGFINNPEEYKINREIIDETNAKLLDLYTKKLVSNQTILKINDMYEKLYSEYKIITDSNITKLSKFISENDSIHIEQKNRFEKIFSKKKKIKLNKENIELILSKFINSNLDYEDIILYIQEIQYILSLLSSDPTVLTDGTIMSNKVPKEWKLLDSITNNFQNFLNKNEDIQYKTELLLHDRVLGESFKDKYLGFNTYKKISNSHIYFKSLQISLSKMFQNLDLLKGDTMGMYNVKYSTTYMKYHLTEIFMMIIEFINDLQINKGTNIDDANPLFQLLEGRNEDIIEENITIFSQFIMDLITNILLSNYDTNWLFMNKNKIDLMKKLSRQKEREKEEILKKKDSASKDELLLMKYNQEIGKSNMWKEAAESHSKFINSKEWIDSSETERLEKISEIYGDLIEVYEDDINIPIMNPKNENQDETDHGSYYDQELNEDNEEFLDNYDEEQETEFNE